MSVVSSIVMACNFERAWCFGATYHLYLQDWQSKQETSKKKMVLNYLLFLLFKLKDGDDMFFQNIELFLNYTALCPRELVIITAMRTSNLTKK
jgi:hypothetical protein